MILGTRKNRTIIANIYDSNSDPDVYISTCITNAVSSSAVKIFSVCILERSINNSNDNVHKNYCSSNANIDIASVSADSYYLCYYSKVTSA